MTEKTLAVVDDDATDAMIVGWAGSSDAAMRVALRLARDRRMSIEAVRLCPVSLHFDPDLHWKEDWERVTADGQAWVIIWRDDEPMAA